ncbi:MAG: SH3 domain-containing protein [Phycisphaerae bacterium]|nr:SH3 domain-containing protein [Tepidisphaeraceae bacterium]
MRRLAGLVALSVLSGSALAEDVFVKQSRVVVREGKGAAYDEVTTVAKGDRLQVVGREGPWIKVRAKGREGYVFESAVADQKPGEDLGAGLSKMLGGNAQASSASDAAAGKGLGEALDLAKSRGQSTAGLQKMKAIRKSVSGKDWEQFTREGNVGPNK